MRLEVGYSRHSRIIYCLFPPLSDNLLVLSDKSALGYFLPRRFFLTTRVAGTASTFSKDTPR